VSLAILLALLGLGEPGHVRTCEAYDFTESNALTCLETGITYPEGSYALTHDEGEIVLVEVWQ